MIRKLVALLIAASLLAACARPALPEEDDLPLEGELVIAMHRYDGLAAALREVIRSFEEKHPGATVQVHEWQRPPFDSTRPVTKEIIDRAFEGVDLYLVTSSFTVRDLHEHGYLMDLSLLTRPDPDPLLAEWLHEEGVINGEQIYVPIVTEPIMVMVNEVAFEQLGLAVPEIDWTYDDLEWVLRELAARNLLSRTRLERRSLLNAMHRAYGGEYYNFDEERWELDSPANRAAFGLLAHWISDGLLAEGNSLTYETSHEEAAILTTSFGRRLQGWRAVPFPMGPVRRKTTGVSGVYGAILNTTEHPELATAFLAELLSPDVGAMALARAGIRPLVDAPEAMDAWREQVGSDWAAAHEAGLTGLRRERQMPFASFSFTTELLDALEAGSWTPDMLSELDRRLNQ